MPICHSRFASIAGCRIRSFASADRRIINPATAGFGMQVCRRRSRAQSTGVGDDAQKVDMPVRLRRAVLQETGKSLGTLSRLAVPRRSAGRSRRPQVRSGAALQADYHPSSLTLKDFRFDRYAGTNTAKNLFVAGRSSKTRSTTSTANAIWMNNPLRYAGTTFYQSSFDRRDRNRRPSCRSSRIPAG